MKPFRATYHRTNYRGEPVGEPETVLVIAILSTQSEESEAIAVFVHTDGRLDQDEIFSFTGCRIPWPEG